MSEILIQFRPCPGGYIFQIPLAKVPTDLEGRIYFINLPCPQRAYFKQHPLSTEGTVTQCGSLQTASKLPTGGTVAQCNNLQVATEGHKPTVGHKLDFKQQPQGEAEHSQSMIFLQHYSRLNIPIRHLCKYIRIIVYPFQHVEL